MYSWKRYDRINIRINKYIYSMKNELTFNGVIYAINCSKGTTTRRYTSIII